MTSERSRHKLKVDGPSYFSMVNLFLIYFPYILAVEYLPIILIELMYIVFMLFDWTGALSPVIFDPFTTR